MVLWFHSLCYMLLLHILGCMSTALASLALLQAVGCSLVCPLSAHMYLMHDLQLLFNNELALHGYIFLPVALQILLLIYPLCLYNSANCGRQMEHSTSDLEMHRHVHVSDTCACFYFTMHDQISFCLFCNWAISGLFPNRADNLCTQVAFRHYIIQDVTCNHAASCIYALTGQLRTCKFISLAWCAFSPTHTTLCSPWHTALCCSNTEDNCHWQIRTTDEKMTIGYYACQQ